MGPEVEADEPAGDAVVATPPGAEASTVGSDRAPMAVVTSEVDGVEIVEPERPTYVRAAGDSLRVALAGAVFLLALLVAAVFRSVVSGAEDDVYRLTGLVPETLAKFLVAMGAYMGVLAPIALLGLLIYLRRLRLALMVLLAGVAAKVAMDLISRLLAVNVALPADLGQVRFISYPGPGFLAAGAAIVTVIDPWIPRVLRRVAIGTVILVAFTRIVSGANVPYDVVMASVLGWLVGAIVVALLGSPNRAPLGRDVVAALTKAGIPLRRLEVMGRGLRGATIYKGTGVDGVDRFVKVFSGDQRDADTLVQLYRWIRLREASDERTFSTLRRSVEHEALLALKAVDDGIPTARMQAVSEVAPDGMQLAFDWLPGDALEGRGDAITTEQLHDLWRVAGRLQAAGIAHRDLNLAHFIVDGDEHPRVVDFSFGELAANEALLRTDVAELLCSTAVEVGAERAVAAAVDILGQEPVADAVGRLQPLALTVHTRRAVGAVEGLLDEVRDEVQRATGLDDVHYEELARIRPRTVVTVVVFAIALYALLPQLADLGQVQEQITNINAWWVLPIILFQLTTYVGAGMGMLGSVPDRVAFIPTMRAQVAAAFVDVLAPASIGGMALNTRFLQKRGVDPGVAVAGVGVNAIGGLLGHVLLLGAFLLWAGSSTLDSATGATSSSSSATSTFPTGTVLIVVGVVLALTVGFFVLPPGRRLFNKRIRPLVKDAIVGLGQLARRPRKLLAVVGGSIIVTLGFTMAFICTVEAFGGGPSVAQLGVAYLAAWAVAVFAPTPGGLGALELVLVAALGRLGMPSEAAVSSVLVFRTFTFWLPVLPGWVTFTWMQRRGEI